MTTRFLTLIAALALTLVSGVRTASAQGTAAIDAIVGSAQELVAGREEAILDTFLAYVERDAGPRELKRLARDLSKGAVVTFNGFERQVNVVADEVARTLRRGGASSTEVGDVRTARQAALNDLKDLERDLRAYIKDTLEDALNGTLTPPDDGDGGGGGPGNPGNPGNPGG